MRLTLLWMNNLKVAIIENDIEHIGRLIQEVPTFTDLDEAKAALALIQESIRLVDIEKIKLVEVMKKIKQTKAFLQS